MYRSFFKNQSPRHSAIPNMYKLRTNKHHGCTEYTFMVKYIMKKKSIKVVIRDAADREMAKRNAGKKPAA